MIIVFLPENNNSRVNNEILKTCDLKRMLAFDDIFMVWGACAVTCPVH